MTNPTEPQIQLGGACLFCGVQHGEKHKFNCNLLTMEEVDKICQPFSNNPYNYTHGEDYTKLENIMNYEEAREKDREDRTARDMFKPPCICGRPYAHTGDCNMLTNEEVALLRQPSKPSALDTQVGGSHYKNFAIQPIEFTTKNKLGFIQGTVIKRICRYNQPGGKGLEDLEKIIHEVNCLIEMDYGSNVKI